MKNIFLILFILIFSAELQAQESEMGKTNIEFKGSVAETNICFNCELDSILKGVNKRISQFKIDSNHTYKVTKGDTLIETIIFDKFGGINYSYYSNNLLKINYLKSYKDQFTLTIMNAHEMELKEWYSSKNELHITNYDEKSNLKNYLVILQPDSLTKIEFQKKWKEGNYKSGQKRTYHKTNNIWLLSEKRKVKSNEWPNTGKDDEMFRAFASEEGIYSSISLGSFKYMGDWLIENTDTIIFTYNTYYQENKLITTKSSFLPYKLKDGLETGTYYIYEKNHYHGKILIDAQILNGKLHGVYNEYDLKTGKIKIYCVYNQGQLHGRKTTYYYDNKGYLAAKKTELWKNGEFIKVVP